jgi:putative toxin-antitoxin system antitoxin component (TIGR02293 family)
MSLVAPGWSEYLNERCVRHSWSCENCGYEFETVVLFSASEVQPVPVVRARPQLIDDLLSRGFSEEEVFALVLPAPTLAQRRAENEPLTVEETDKVRRLGRIADQAERVFGDRVKANRWLRKPKRELKDQTPLAYLQTEASARVVEEMLNRIEHGIFA